MKNTFFTSIYLVLKEQKASTVLIGTEDGAVVEIVLNFANLQGSEKGHLQYFLEHKGTYLKFTKLHKQPQLREGEE